MSFGYVDPDAFKKYLNKLYGQGKISKATMMAGCCPKGATGCTGPSGCPTGHTGPTGCTGSTGSCNCSGKCKDYCKEEKSNSETAQDDGCFCRKCKKFQPMVEPDDKGDGKCLCYGCAHPWG